MLWNSCHATQPEGKLTPNPQVTGGTESQTLPLMTQSVTLVPTPLCGGAVEGSRRQGDREANPSPRGHESGRCLPLLHEPLV